MADKKQEIEKLTEAQSARLPEFRDKWIKIGTDCSPLDFEKARDAAIMAYKAAKLTPPSLFIKSACPVSNCLDSYMIKIAWFPLSRADKTEDKWDDFIDELATACVSSK